MHRLFPWLFCTLLSVIPADHIVKQQNNSCGTFSLITSECKGRNVILRYTPSIGLTVSKVEWTLDHFRSDLNRWKDAYNSTALSIFANDTGHYIVWRTREKERPYTDFLITVHSQPPCSGVFTYIRVPYQDFKDCTTNDRPEVEETNKHTFRPTLLTNSESRDDGTTESYTTRNMVHVTSPTNRRNSIILVSQRTHSTTRVTRRTTNMDSGMSDAKGTERKKSYSKDADKTEDMVTTARGGSRIETNEPDTNSKIGSNNQSAQDKQETVSTEKASAVERKESHILTVILATLGGLVCVTIIVIAILVYRKKKGNKPEANNGNGNLQQDAQPERGVRNGYEFVSQDTPEVLYAQVEKKHKTLQNASLAAQLRTNETDRHDDNVQQTEPVRGSQTVTTKEEETVQNNEDTNQELVYIQLDMDHLNKSSTQRKSAERKDEDKTEYVGIDFAKTSQIQAN